MDVVFALLAAILHLGNIEMAVEPESDEVIVMNEEEIDYGRLWSWFVIMIRSLLNEQDFSVIHCTINHSLSLDA